MTKSSSTNVLQGRGRDAVGPDELLPVLYRELRQLATRLLADERSDHTLTPTALVHEVYLRLAGTPIASDAYQSQSQFFWVAATAMRRVLIESARKKRALKRGGNQMSVTLDNDLVGGENWCEVEALDDALTDLSSKYPDLSELVTLRYFAGMTMPQAAKVLNISLRKAERNWHFARAWLKAELGK